MPEVKITGVMLEHVAQKAKEGDSVFHSLIVYEQGQKYRRSVVEVKIPSGENQAASLALADRLVGKVGSILCDMSAYDNKVTYYLKNAA